MSANRKKVLFISLASLLASSTAVVALVAHPGNSNSTPRVVPAQVTADVDEAESVAGASDLYPTTSSVSEGYSAAGCSASVEDGCQFTALALGDEAVVPINFRVDTSLESYSPLSDVIAATQSAAGQSFFGDGFGTSEDRFSLDDRQLISGITDQVGGAYNVAAVQRQFQLDSLGSLSDFNSLLALNSSSHASRPIAGGNDTPSGGGNDTPSGGGNDTPTGGGSNDNTPTPPGNDTQDRPCDVFTGCVSSDHAPDVVPNPPTGGSGPATSVPEPGTMGMLAFGLALAAGVRRRRRA